MEYSNIRQSSRLSIAPKTARIYGWTPSNACFDRENSYPEETRLLRLKIFSGHNLAKKDIFGASDPYVRIDLLLNDRTVIDSVYTKTKKKTLNPCWNEEFIFRVIPSSHLLLIEVFDENRLTRDDFLGKVELSLTNISTESDSSEVTPTRYILQQRSAKSKVRGDLEIYHAFIADSNSRTNFHETSMVGEDSEWEIVTHPTQVLGHEATNESSEELPSGWEECQDTIGRTYYVNHNSRTTQWERPTNICETGSNATVPDQVVNSATIASPLDATGQSAGDAQRIYNHSQNFSRRFQIGSSMDRSSIGSDQSANTGANSSSSSMDDSSSSFQHANSSMSEAVQRTKPNLINESGSIDSSGSLLGVSDDNTSRISPTLNEQTPTNLESNTDDRTTEEAAPQIDNFLNGDQLANQLAITAYEMSAGAQRRHSEPSVSTEASTETTTNTNTTTADADADQIGEAINPQSQMTAQQRPHSHHHHHHHRHNHTNSPSQTSQSANHTTTNSESAPVQRPRAQTSTTHRSSRHPVPDDGLGPLPAGWSQQIAETGRIFFIDHNTRTTTWIDPRTGRPSPSPQSQHNSRSTAVRGFPDKSIAVDDLGPLPPGWEERVHRDGRIFFINHNSRSTQWDDPRIDNPSISGPPLRYSRDYKQKHDFFMNSLPRPTNVPNKFEVKVSRLNILEDSFRIISNVSRVDYLKTKLWIEFDHEEVLDYGGPCREWFYLLSKEMFNPYYGLFEYSSADKYTLQIKPYSGRCNESHLAYFKFIGRVAGMAIYHGKLLDAFFIRPFYKMMLGKQIDLKDMESVDSEYFNSLKYILENDPSELYLNFSIDERFLDVVEEKELKPNGAKIPVTNENKREYISLVIDWRFVSRVKAQMSAFLEGFHEIIPKKSIEIFDENELELLMCGIGNVDVKDWKQNTVYKGGYVQNHIVIQWFWRVILSFTNEMRSRLLQFVTGTSRVPMNGFKELYGSNGPQLFTIEKWGTPQNLPRSHTCFNRLDLPCYESYSDLREKLIKAVEGSETYGGVD